MLVLWGRIHTGRFTRVRFQGNSSLQFTCSHSLPKEEVRIYRDPQRGRQGSSGNEALPGEGSSSASESGTLKWTSNTPVSQSSLLHSYCTCCFVPLQDTQAVRWCQPKTSHQHVLKSGFFGFCADECSSENQSKPSCLTQFCFVSSDNFTMLLS